MDQHQINTFELPHTADYSKNSRHVAPNASPCAVCGKSVLNPKYWVHVVWGTEIILPDVEWPDPSSDLGCQPVGVACVKNHPELKPYLYHGWNKYYNEFPKKP